MPAALFSVLTPILSEVISKHIGDKNQAGKILHAVTDGLNSRQQDMQVLLAEMNKSQMQVNKAEAKNSSIWVAGWRPAIGWVCVAGLGWMVLLEPLLHYLLHLTDSDISLPTLEYDLLFELTFGMLGMAGLRSFDKLKGTSF